MKALDRLEKLLKREEEKRARWGLASDSCRGTARFRPAVERYTKALRNLDRLRRLKPRLLNAWRVSAGLPTKEERA
jgi:hypothetical protein